MRLRRARKPGHRLRHERAVCRDEAKAPEGKAADHQKEFQKKLEAAGGRYVLAYSLEDVPEII